MRSVPRMCLLPLPLPQKWPGFLPPSPALLSRRLHAAAEPILLPVACRKHLGLTPQGTSLDQRLPYTHSCSLPLEWETGRHVPCCSQRSVAGRNPSCLPLFPLHPAGRLQLTIQGPPAVEELGTDARSQAELTLGSSEIRERGSPGIEAGRGGCFGGHRAFRGRSDALKVISTGPPRPSSSLEAEAGNKSPRWSWSQHGPPCRKASSAASFA